MRGGEWARQRHKEEEEQEEEKRQHHFSHLNTRLTDYNPRSCNRMEPAPTSPGKKALLGSNSDQCWQLGKEAWEMASAVAIRAVAGSSHFLSLEKLPDPRSAPCPLCLHSYLLPAFPAVTKWGCQ